MDEPEGWSGGAGWGAFLLCVAKKMVATKVTSRTAIAPISIVRLAFGFPAIMFCNVMRGRGPVGFLREAQLLGPAKDAPRSPSPLISTRKDNRRCEASAAHI